MYKKIISRLKSNQNTAGYAFPEEAQPNQASDFSDSEFAEVEQKVAPEQIPNNVNVPRRHNGNNRRNFTQASSPLAAIGSVISLTPFAPLVRLGLGLPLLKNMVKEELDELSSQAQALHHIVHVAKVPMKDILACPRQQRSVLMQHPAAVSRLILVEQYSFQGLSKLTVKDLTELLTSNHEPENAEPLAMHV
jgi:hypothetical protein